MKRHISNLFWALLFTWAVYSFTIVVESDYFIKFLRENLLLLLVALLAINSTTLGIVLTKIRDIIDITQGDCFTKTRKAMFLSIIEQIGLIILGLLLLIFDSSKFMASFLWIQKLICFMIEFCFVYSIFILFDTSKSVFLILDVRVCDNK